MKETGTAPRGADLVNLRTLMGDGQTPIPPPELNRLTGISLDSIRSIETDRRPLSPKILRKIQLSLGAAWDPEKGWMFAYKSGIPFNAEVFRIFSSRVALHPYQMDLDAHAACLRVLGLLREADIDRYQALLYSLNASLEDLEKEFGNQKTREIFEATEMSIGIGRDAKDGALSWVSREYLRLPATKAGKVVEEIRIPPAEPGQLVHHGVLARRDFMLDFRELRRATNYEPRSPRQQYEEFDAEQKAPSELPALPSSEKARRRFARREAKARRSSKRRLRRVSSPGSSVPTSLGTSRDH